MADNNGLFFNSINGDRVYNADSFAEWLQKFFTTGVFNGEMQVTPGSGMMVNVAPGYANINGKVRFFDTMQAFTIDPASGTYPRIDAIMVRLDETARNISTVYVKGDYSGDTPTAPAPVRSEGVYDIVLAHIAVNAGQTAITAANITDTRTDETLCGWVSSTVESIPVDQITTQMQAEFLAWYNRMKDQLSEDAAGHLQAEIDTLNEAQTATANIVRRHGYDFGPENTGTTATQAFSKGDYFMQDNQFAQATADIAEGDTVELGTNYRATTVGDELEALNKGLRTFTPVSAVSNRVTELSGGYAYLNDHTVFVQISGTININVNTAYEFAAIIGLPSPMIDVSIAMSVLNVGSLNGFSSNARVGIDGAITFSLSESSNNVYGKTFCIGGLYYVNS